jgi:hypothetical protein
VLHPLLLLAWCCWQRSKEAKAKRARSERAKKQKSKRANFCSKKAGLKKSTGSGGTLWILNFKASFKSLKIIFEIFLLSKFKFPGLGLLLERRTPLSSD